jgi:ABC-type sugar transport system ATPase subunit
VVASDEPPLLEARSISKSFGPVRVLDRVSFSIRPGEVHVLAGANGAGKSTLIKVLSGVHTEYEGQLLRRGASCRFRGPLDAVSAGIATIHQELSLVGPMSVADNLDLGGKGAGRGSAAARREAARRLLAAVRLDLDPETPVEELPLPARQLVEIAKALGRDAEVLIMDEPTSALDERSAGVLFETVERLVAEGRGVVYISHRLPEIARLAHRITVLRDGRTVATETAADLPRDRLVSLMVGRSLAPQAPRAPRPRGEPLLEVEGLLAPGMAHPISFSIRRGEIVGLAGLEGSGRSEVLHGLFGSLGPARGRATLAGKPLALTSPAQSIEQGVVLVANDRQAAGLVPEMSVLHNATLASLPAESRFGWLDEARERAAAAPLLRWLGVEAPLDAPVRALSGGNQQKVWLARCALCAPQVLLLDEPTRGIDVGAKADVHERMLAWAERGAGIAFAAAETEDLLALCDRILVLSRGAIVANLGREEATMEGVLHLAMGGGGS